MFFKQFPSAISNRPYVSVVPGENDQKQTAEDKEAAVAPEAEPLDNGMRELLNGAGEEDNSDSDNQNGGYVISEAQFSFDQYVQR